MSNLKDKRQNIILGLERITGFLNFLGNPQDNFRSVIIGGTNGKGSTTYYLSNIALQSKQLKVGRYISPHLIALNERFVINEKQISDTNLHCLLSEIKEKLQTYEDTSGHRLTEFEYLTAAVFQYFSDEKIDLAFLEVGLGGRLDATNVVKTENVLCSIITNISYDHMDYLGETLEEIAFEKAGIIKEKNTLITNAKDKGLNVLLKEAKSKSCEVIDLDLNTELDYITIAKEIAKKSWEIIKKKINIKTNEDLTFLDDLYFEGRFQYIQDRKILLDGAHNPDGAKELKKLLTKHFYSKKIVFIIGILDKDYKTYLSTLLTKNDTVICTEPKSKRATDKNIINDYISSQGIQSMTALDLSTALELASSLQHDLTVITGSLYLVGEALAVCKNLDKIQ